MELTENNLPANFAPIAEVKQEPRFASDDLDQEVATRPSNGTTPRRRLVVQLKRERRSESPSPPPQQPQPQRKKNKELVRGFTTRCHIDDDYPRVDCTVVPGQVYSFVGFGVLKALKHHHEPPAEHLDRVKAADGQFVTVLGHTILDVHIGGAPGDGYGHSLVPFLITRGKGVSLGLDACRLLDLKTARTELRDGNGNRIESELLN